MKNDQELAVFSEQGLVVVNVLVNRTGIVSSAKVDIGRCNTADIRLWDSATDFAKGLGFDANPAAAPLQKIEMVFRY